MKDYRAAYNAFMKCYPFTLADIEGEEWRNIEGYDDYQVSNFGRVKSFKQGKNFILKPRIGHDGYLLIGIYQQGKQVWRKIHRVVAENFILNLDNKPQINHIDGCRLNNYVSNLEWCTASENTRHAYELGLAKSVQGEENYQASATNEIATYIRDNPERLSQSALAKKFGMTKSSVSLIQIGKTYKNAGGVVRPPKNGHKTFQKN